MQSLTRQCRVLGLASGSDDALSLLSAGRFLPLLLGIDGVEHEVIEAVAAIVAVFAEIEVNFCALWQLQGRVFVGEWNRTVLDDLMFTE